MTWKEEKRICPVCEVEFFANAHNQKYCSEACKQHAENERWYQKNRERRIKQVVERRRERAKSE